MNVCNNEPIELYFETFLCIMDLKNEKNTFLATFTT